MEAHERFSYDETAGMQNLRDLTAAGKGHRQLS